MIDVRMFTVGPVQENCFIVRAKGSEHGLIVDPGDEADRHPQCRSRRLRSRRSTRSLSPTRTSITSAPSAPVAKATNAPVYCPELERQVLANIMDYVPWPGFGPFESYEADHTVKGGETLELAGLTIDVIFTPGHSPGHVTYAIRDAGALFSGDVLFQGSVGRVDLPGGDWPTLLSSIETLMDRFTDDTTVYPGHMGITTLGRERAMNPFLRELAANQ